MMGSTDQNEQIEFLLSKAIDGSLSDDEQRQLDNAIEADPSLADVLTEYRNTNRAIQDWATELPEVDWERFTRTIREGCLAGSKTIDHHGPRRILRILTPLAVAATVAFVFIITQKSPTSTESAFNIEVVYAQPTSPAAGTIEISFDQTDASAPEELAPSIAMAAVGTQVRWPEFEDAIPGR